ncbi:hypothetical protein HPB48_027015 [Haemaphysalis longicornis]|uniref:Uncharacterized protein n=1 Tax=Haemaphysalis longicornis TaxID=44386 RepID=A0A9J6HB46_HAELO|nr:hypothetical protein HPB48_027015 [Haemaphysalis longicornis]
MSTHSFVTVWLTNFGRDLTNRIVSRTKAEHTLTQRAQVPGENCTTYIEEVLKLGGLVNPSMTDEEKVGNLLKCIVEDVYNYIITKEDMASAQDVIRHCRAFETLKIRRITPSLDAWRA